MKTIKRKQLKFVKNIYVFGVKIPCYIRLNVIKLKK